MNRKPTETLMSRRNLRRERQRGIQKRKIMIMRVSPLIFVVPAATICMVAQPAAATPEDVIIDSTDTIASFVSSRNDRRIPRQIIRRAKGIAILPGVITGGFIFGGTGGSGTLMIRDDRGRWGNPIIVSLSAGSFGLQAGAKSTDVILVFMSKHSIRSTLRESFALGGNVSVAGGPVGGNAVTPTDAPDSDIYSYTRSQGLFAGVALEGSKIAYDRDETEKLYQRRNLSAERVLRDRSLPISAVIRELHQVLYNAQR